LLRYFKINDPYRLLVILAILFVLALPYFLDPPPLTHPELKSIVIGEKVREGHSPYTDLVDFTGPLSAWFYAVSHFLFGDSLYARHIFAFVLLFLQGAILGFIFIDKKVFQESSFLPPLIFGILCLFSFDTLALTGDLMGGLFLIFALNSLFKELEFREQGNENVFNAGLFIGIASLFTFSFGLYIIAAITILGLYSRSTSPKFLLVLVGFTMPHLLLISAYYMKEGTTSLWAFYYLPNLRFENAGYFSLRSFFLLCVIPVGFLITSLVILTRDARFTKYQSQIVQALFFWMFFSIIHLWLTNEFRPQSVLVLFPALAYLITHMLLMIRRKRIAEIFFWILLVGVIGISYLSRYGKIGAVQYDSLIVKETNSQQLTGKRILVLGDHPEWYKENSLATPFFNWALSKPIFEHPEYYENVFAVYHGFKADPPEVIVDSTGYLAPFLERIPELKNQYQKSAGGYTRISN